MRQQTWREIKDRRAKRIFVFALWAVCLTPLWVALYHSPETFWQSASVGCAQLFTGLVAVAGTALAYFD